MRTSVNKLAAGILAAVLMITTLSGTVYAEEQYATSLESGGPYKPITVSDEIKEILTSKTPDEKNARIMAEVEKARQMPIASNAYPNWPEGPVVESPAAILMDIDTGAVLYEKNVTDAHYPASITKVMTLLLAMEHGNPEQEVVFSHDAIYNIEPGSANAGMKEGEKVTLDTCLRVVMSLSANECAYATAETVGGDYATFIQMMNDKAAELGCLNSHFMNPHGLFDENHYVCTYDMALIASAAYQYEWFRDLCNIPTYKRPLTEMNPTDDWAIRNRHQMLHPENDYYYPGITGGKTGFTDEARNTLVTFAERDGMRLVCVTMQTEGVRVYHTTKALFDYGFENFERISVDTLLDPSIVSNIRKGVGATVPKGTKQADVFAAVSLDNSSMPVGVLSNMAHADFQYGGHKVGSADLTLNMEYARTLWSSPEEEVREEVPEEEPEADSLWKHLNKWLIAMAVLFLAALILMIVAIVNLSKMRKKRRKKKVIRTKGDVKKDDTDR